MINPNRFGLLIVALLVGVFISWLSIEVIVLLFSVLLFAWFLIWDEKSYRKMRRKHRQEDDDYRQHYQA